MTDAKKSEHAPRAVHSHTGLRGIAAYSVFMGKMRELEGLKWGLRIRSSSENWVPSKKPLLAIAS